MLMAYCALKLKVEAIREISVETELLLAWWGDKSM
jgi:hypothetical protein